MVLGDVRIVLGVGVIVSVESRASPHVKKSEICTCKNGEHTGKSPTTNQVRTHTPNTHT